MRRWRTACSTPSHDHTIPPRWGGVPVAWAQGSGGIPPRWDTIVAGGKILPSHRHPRPVSLRNTTTSCHRHGNADTQHPCPQGRRREIPGGAQPRRSGTHRWPEGGHPRRRSAGHHHLVGKRRQPNAPFILGLGNRTIREALSEVEGRGGEFVVIDTPPHAQPIINIAAEAADASLIITGPFPEDLEQVGAVASIVARLARPAGIVLNKATPKTTALSLAACGPDHVQPADLSDRDHATCRSSLRIGGGAPPFRNGNRTARAQRRWPPSGNGRKSSSHRPRHPTIPPSPHPTRTSSRRNTKMAA